MSYKMKMSFESKKNVGITVLQKMQNPGSPNGPPMVDGWVVRLSSG